MNNQPNREPVSDDDFASSLGPFKDELKKQMKNKSDARSAVTVFERMSGMNDEDYCEIIYRLNTNSPCDSKDVICQNCPTSNMIRSRGEPTTCITRMNQLKEAYAQVLKSKGYEFKNFKFTFDQMLTVACSEILEQSKNFQNESFRPKDLDDCIDLIKDMIDKNDISIDMLKGMYVAASMNHTMVIEYNNDRMWTFFHGKGTREELLNMAIMATKKALKKSPFGKNYFKKK